MDIIIYSTILIIAGILIIVLALALCKMAARCSAKEQAIMDDEQAAAMKDWAAVTGDFAVSANDWKALQIPDDEQAAEVAGKKWQERIDSARGEK